MFSPSCDKLAAGFRWSEKLWRSAGGGGRRLAAQSTQQTSHLQQGVDAFSHPHVSVTNLLKHDRETIRGAGKVK